MDEYADNEHDECVDNSNNIRKKMLCPLAISLEGTLENLRYFRKCMKNLQKTDGGTEEYYQ